MNATKHTPTPDRISWLDLPQSTPEALAKEMATRYNAHAALTARVAELEKALDALSLASYGAVNAPGVTKYAEAFERAQVCARAALGSGKE